MGGFRPHTTGITSPFKIVANIFISFIGAGMLGLPYAFKEAGLVEGALIMCVVGYLSTSAMLMLIDCKYAILSSGGRAGGRSIVMERKTPLLPPSSDSDSGDSEDSPVSSGLRCSDLTYGDVGLYAFGQTGKRLVDVAVVVSQVGFCCGYLIYMCKNLSVYAPLFTQHQWMLLLLPPLYCLTLLRHLNKLAIFSLFAQVSNVFALTVVFWFDFSHSESVPFVPKEFSLKGMPFFFAIAIYCYEGAGLILSMEESVAEQMRPKFRSIFVVTLIGLTILYVCFGASGYISFGPHTEDIITLNLPQGEGIVDFAALVKVCLGVSLFFTYPMMLFPVSHLLDKTCHLNSTSAGNFMRLLIVCSTGLVVLIIPNFGVLISLIGATCCTLLAFILPAVFHLKIFRSRLTKHQFYFNTSLVLIGVLGSVVGLWDTFSRMGHEARVTVDELSPVAPSFVNVTSERGVLVTSSAPFLLNTALVTMLSNVSVLGNKTTTDTSSVTSNVSAASLLVHPYKRSNLSDALELDSVASNLIHVADSNQEVVNRNNQSVPTFGLSEDENVHFSTLQSMVNSSTISREDKITLLKKELETLENSEIPEKDVKLLQSNSDSSPKEVEDSAVKSSSVQNSNTSQLQDQLKSTVDSQSGDPHSAASPLDSGDGRSIGGHLR